MTMLPTSARIAELEAALAEAGKALEQTNIGIGMGWDLDGYVEQNKAAVATVARVLPTGSEGRVLGEDGTC